MKVFQVEDSQAVRERLRGMMAGISGIDQVGEADNEEDAMRGILSVLPDVVILDLSLVSGSGMDVLRRIRLQPFDIRVIVLTNHNYPHYRERCFELGADYFLDKSNEISKLEELLIQFSENIMSS